MTEVEQSRQEGRPPDADRAGVKNNARLERAESAIERLASDNARMASAIARLEAWAKEHRSP